MLPERKMNCPHCREENSAFGPQRCGHCGLNMMSDQLQALREQKLKPLAEKLDEQLLFMRAGNNQAVAVSYARELYKSLVVYENHADFSFLKPLLEQARTALAAFPEKKRKDNRKQMSWLVFIILILFPLVSLLLEKELSLAILLFLPVVGWFFMGILPLLKMKKKEE